MCLLQYAYFHNQVLTQRYQTIWVLGWGWVIAINVLSTVRVFFHNQVQSNLDSSNTDGSFTMANSNSFLNPYGVLPIAQENKYLGKFSYFIVKVCCVYSLESPHRGDSNEYTQHTIIVQKIKKKSLNYRHLLPDVAP